MARHYLVVPATSASAQRLFSSASRIFDDMSQRGGGYAGDGDVVTDVGARQHEQVTC